MRARLLTGGTQPSNRQLGQIVFLLAILALSLFVAFCYFASSLCITVVLACFFAVLVDPVIMLLERLRVPRVVSAAVVMVAAMMLIGGLTYFSYRQVSGLVDNMPAYADRLGHVIAPVMKKMKLLEDSAGRISTEVPTKKIPEVKVKSHPDWNSYLVRGVGPVSGAVIIIGVVPFLTYFLLSQKRRIQQKFAVVSGEVIDVPVFSSKVTGMIRGFVLGNLLIGLLMSVVTAVVLIALKIDGAVVLGIASGLLNLLPFLGAIAGSLIPLGAALAQNQPLSTMLLILLTVIVLHTVAINLLVPKIIGERVSISPVAATIGIMFWGWLWGLIGVVLAVPLTALVKIIADSHPSLDKLAKVLAERPDFVAPRLLRVKGVKPESEPGLEPRGAAKNTGRRTG